MAVDVEELKARLRAKHGRRLAARAAQLLPPGGPDPLTALEERLPVEEDPRLAFLDALLASPHGRLAEFGRVHERVREADPEFYGCVAAWYRDHGVIEDQRQLFCAHLAISPLEAHREASFVLLQTLRTYQVARVVRYLKEVRHTLPRRTRSAVRGWLARREAEPAWFDEVALRDRRNLKYLYATLRLRPPARAAAILFEDRPPAGSRLAAIKALAAERDPRAIAEGIVRHRIFAGTAVGLLRGLDASGLAALVEVMSPQQVLNSLRAFARRGALEHPEIRARIEAKLERARTESRVQSARTLAAAGAIDDPELRARLGRLAAERLRRMGTITRRTALFVDKSGSMERAIEVGCHLAAVVSTVAASGLEVIAFDAIARRVRGPDRPDLEGWAAAFSHLHANGQTSIGAPFEVLARDGTRVEQAVVITDGEENTAPYFVDALRAYEARMETRVGVMLVLVGSRRGTSTLERRLVEAGVDAVTWVFDGDLYSLPNLVPYLAVPRRQELAARILETKLPTRADLATLPRGFDPETCELL